MKCNFGTIEIIKLLLSQPPILIFRKPLMIKYIFTFLFFPFISTLFAQVNVDSTYIDSVNAVTFCAVGDLMCHSTQFKYAQVSKDSFDFKPVYRYVKPIIEKADVAIGNLETTLAGSEREYSGYPNFNSPDEYLEALKYAGFDILITANNHSLDTGKKGALRTIQKITEHGLLYNGTNKNEKERDSIRVYEVKGLRLAFLSYTYGTNNTTPKGQKYLINNIDTLLIKDQLNLAKQLFPDLIMVYFHFGNEYEREPSKEQREIVEKTLGYGGDIILASHPHVIQSVQKFESEWGRIDSGFVAYSLGNFISNQRWQYSDCGVILNFTVTKKGDDSKLYLSDLSFVPTWVFKGNTGIKNEYIILPSNNNEVDSTYKFISEDDLQAMNESYNDTIEILSKEVGKEKEAIPQVDAKKE